MLPKYKLLTTLYLCQRFSFPSPSVDIFRHLLGVSYGQTLSRLIKEKLIHSRIPDLYSSDPGSLSITYLGTNALLSHYPLLDYFLSSSRIPDLYPSDPGSKSFTLVVFNIPEEKRRLRDRLRYVLKSAGFGQINHSLYLSPHLTVKEAGHLLSSRPRLSELKGEAFGRLGFAFNVPLESFKEIDKETIMSFWDLKEVEELYEEALSVLPSIDNAQLKIDNNKRNSQFSPVGAGRFLSKFLDAFGKDPFLPPLLLGNNWPGRKALEIAKEIITGN